MSDLQNLYSDSKPAASKQEWFVVYAKARQEDVALQNLERQQFHCYLPRIQLSKRRNGQIVPSIEPFFPRYLFVRLALQDQDWAPIRSTRGVCGLVRFEGVPKRIPEQFINLLKENEDSQYLQRVIDKSWKSGDQVKIEQGPFAGYQCIFQQKRGADRVSVLLDIVGKPTRATLLKDDLQLPQYA